MEKDSWKGKVVTFFGSVGILIFSIFCIYLFVSLFTYPAFPLMLATTLVVSMVIGERIVNHFGGGVNFLGTELYPYVGIATGAYISFFLILHALRWLDFLDLEIQWRTLTVVVLVSVVISSTTCWLVEVSHRQKSVRKSK